MDVKKLSVIFERLLNHCAPPPPLPSPWQDLSEPPKVIGPVRDRDALIVDLREFADDELEAAGILRHNENGRPQFVAELFDPDFVGLVVRDADERPIAITTANTCLPSSASIPIEVIQDDQWSQQRIRESGILIAAASLNEVRLWRILGVAAAPARGLDQFTHYLDDDANEISPTTDPSYSLYIDNLVKDALAAEAERAARRAADEEEHESSKATASEASSSVTHAEGAPTIPASTTTATADQQDLKPNTEAAFAPVGEPTIGISPTETKPPVDSIEAPLPGRRPKSSNRPLMLLPGGCLEHLTGSIDPPIAAIARFLIGARDLLGCDFDSIRALRPRADFWAQLHFALEHRLIHRAQTLVTEALRVPVPIDELIEPLPIPQRTLRELSDEVVAALRDKAPSTHGRDRLARAWAEYDSYVERTLIAPLRAQAETQRDPCLRALVMLLADAHLEMFRLGPRQQAAHRTASDQPDDLEAQKILFRLCAEHRTRLATLVRLQIHFHRLGRYQW